MAFDHIPTTLNPAFVEVSYLGVDEPVLGGPEGNDNRPHRELAERDEYLKAQTEALDAALAVLKGRVDGIDLSSGTQLRNALLLSWLYKEDSPSFELFSNAFSWRDLAPIGVSAASAGDDTLDLATTEGLKVGGNYVVMDAGTRRLETVEILAIISATRVRTRLNLANTLTLADGARLARTSFDIRDGYALLQDGDVFVSRAITELRAQTSGQIVLRRAADDAGGLTIGYRAPTTVANAPYATAQRTSVVTNADGTRDEFYALGIGGPIEFKIAYANPDATKRVRLDHMVVLPPARAVGNTAVAQPVLVSPADQAANIGQTPTLTLSPYRSLYGVPQGGARFQVATDPAFANLVIDTDTDALAAWNAVSGQSSAFADVLTLGTRDFLAVASGVSQRIQIAADGTVTTTPGTISGDIRRVHGSAALLAAVGANGAIRTSTDLGLSYTTRTPAAAYAGTFSGVFVRNAFVVAVGDGGTIQRSVNAGAVFNLASPDNGYAGTFTDLAGDGAGNLIAVGSGGEIQTSSTDGQVWIKRVVPGNYTGTYRAVAMGTGGFAVAVGDNGALHVTYDYGATWAAKVPAGNFAGSFYGVAVQGSAVVAVGAGAQIQTSTDRAETLFARTAGGGASAALRAVALDANLYGLALGDGGAVQRTLRLDGAVTSFTVPAGYLQVNKVYWARGGYANAEGARSPLSPAVAFSTAASFAYVAAPQIVAPAAGDTAVSIQPTIQLGAFATVGVADTHVASRYQIATGTSFTSPVYDSGDVADLLAHTITALLTAGQAYYVRAYQKGQTLGAGTWSAPVAFTAQNRPNRPAITSPGDGALNVATAPTVTTTAFAMPGGGTQDAIQVQASVSADFASLLYDSGLITDPGKLSGFKLPAGSLPQGQRLYLRARHRATGGAGSLWSNPVQVTTASTAGIAGQYAEVGWSGTGAAKDIVTGVDNTADGLVLSQNRIGGGLQIFSPRRGPGKLISPMRRTTYAENPQPQGVVSFGATGFRVGSGYFQPGYGADFNTAGQSYATWALGGALVQERIVNHVRGTPDVIDLSAFIPNIGMVWLVNLDADAQHFWAAWHKDLPSTHNRQLDFNDYYTNPNQSPGDYFNMLASVVSANGGVVTLTDAATLPTGRYSVMAFRHDPGPDSIAYCGSAKGSGLPDTQVNLPFRPGFLLTVRADTGDGYIRGTGVPNLSYQSYAVPHDDAYALCGGSGAPDGAVFNDKGFAISLNRGAGNIVWPPESESGANIGFLRLFFAVRAPTA